MSSLPPPNLGTREPTKTEYYTLLRDQARRLGLIDWHPADKPLTITSAGVPSFDKYRFTRENINTSEQKFNPVLEEACEDTIDLDTCAEGKDMQWSKPSDVTDANWDEEREALLNAHRQLWVGVICEEVNRRFLELGGNAKVLIRWEREAPNNYVLWWCVEMWRFEQQVAAERMVREKKEKLGQMTSIEKKEFRTKNFKGNAPELQVDFSFLRITIFGDIQQEKLEHIQLQIKPTTTLQGFREQVARLPFIRYFVYQRDPDLAAQLFIHDDKVYPPEGFFPPLTELDENGELLHPERYKWRRDLVYDDGPERGWWSLVVDLKKIEEKNKGMIGQPSEWKAMDTEEDWESLKNLLIRAKGNVSVFMRHKSVEERHHFILAKKDEEEVETTEWKGFRPMNLLLERHLRALREEEAFDKCMEAMAGPVEKKWGAEPENIVE